MLDVAAEQVVCVTHPAHVLVVRTSQLVGTQEMGLELVLDHIIELESAAVDHLQAVVNGRVVRRGDHHAGAVSGFGGQQRQRRRGADAQPIDVDAE